MTDLVTVGSPLTYASLISARNQEQFSQAQENRVLPTCPPVTEPDVRPFPGEQPGQEADVRRCSYDWPYEGGQGRKLDFVGFHHGAPFAVTRWTNLYFPTSRAGFSGDIIGGPVAAEFGPWVRDVAAAAPVKRLAHTWYWSRCAPEGGLLAWLKRLVLRPRDTTQHLAQLRAALALDVKVDLEQLSQQIPAFVLAERIVQQRSAP